MEATTNKYKRIKGINKTVPLFSKTDENITKVTHDELVELRDNGKLLPGHFYRITDYEFTFKSLAVKNAGHQFDIVLVALSKKELAEEGWAMEHPIDVYDVTFNDGVTKKCYIYKKNESDCNIVECSTLLGIDTASYAEGVGQEVIINDELLTATTDVYSSIELGSPNLIYDYFQNSNLSAWKVWYCLDNDESRFGWAKPSKNDIPAYMNNAYVVTGIQDGSKKTIILTRNKDKDNDSNNTGVKLYAYDIIDDELDIEIVQTLYTIEESINIGTIPVYIFYNQSFIKLGDMNVTDIHKYKYISGKGVIYRLIDEYNNDCCCDFKNYMFMDGDHMENYAYILNGDIVHNNKIDNINVDGGKKRLPHISLTGNSIIFNNIVNSNYLYIGNTSTYVEYNSIINSSFIDIHSYCKRNILSGCRDLTVDFQLYTSTLINTEYVNATGAIHRAYIINCNHIHLRYCEDITMFNCNSVTFMKDYIYNLFARDIGNVTITSDSTTSITSIIKNVEILPGIGNASRNITITLPLQSSDSCTIVKPNTVNEIIAS